MPDIPPAIPELPAIPDNVPTTPLAPQPIAAKQPEQSKAAPRGSETPLPISPDVAKLFEGAPTKQEVQAFSLKMMTDMIAAGEARVAETLNATQMAVGKPKVDSSQDKQLS